ncbi:MAG: hypothetical protein ACTHQQ_07035, partial [Solirubrobacteraceae bacterium]
VRNSARQAARESVSGDGPLKAFLACELGSRSDPELAEHLAEVVIDRAPAEKQLIGAGAAAFSCGPSRDLPRRLVWSCPAAERSNRASPGARNPHPVDDPTRLRAAFAALRKAHG